MESVLFETTSRADWERLSREAERGARLVGARFSSELTLIPDGRFIGRLRTSDPALVRWWNDLWTQKDTD